MVYAKGDAVVYPMHGAGIIEDFEDKNIDGICRSYCILRIPIGDLTIMLEASSMENVNLRKVMARCDIARVMDDVVKMPPQPVAGDSSNWNKRYRDNLEKIKSGLLLDAAMVFRSLYFREKQRGLSSAEKKMLSNVKKIMLSEIMLSYNVEKPEAEEILEKSMAAV